MVEIVGQNLHNYELLISHSLLVEGQTSADGRMMAVEQDGPRVINSKVN